MTKEKALQVANLLYGIEEADDIIDELKQLKTEHNEACKEILIGFELAIEQIVLVKTNLEDKLKEL